MWYLMVIPLIVLIGQRGCPPPVKPGVLLGEVVLGGVFLDVYGKLIILFHVRYITAPLAAESNQYQLLLKPMHSYKRSARIRTSNRADRKCYVWFHKSPHSERIWLDLSSFELIVAWTNLSSPRACFLKSSRIR